MIRQLLKLTQAVQDAAQAAGDARQAHRLRDDIRHRMDRIQAGLPPLPPAADKVTPEPPAVTGDGGEAPSELDPELQAMIARVRAGQGRPAATLPPHRARGDRIGPVDEGPPMSARCAVVGGTGCAETAEVHVMHQTKIQQRPRRKFAVHEIARALDLPVREVMDAVSAIGEFVRSPQHRLEEPPTRRLVQYLGHEWPFNEPAAQTAQPTQEAPVTRGLTPPAARPRRNNNPLMTPETRSRDRRYSDARPPRPKRRRTPKAKHFSTHTDPVAMAFADASHDDSPAFADAAWKYHGFAEIERDHWVSMGLRTGQARTAKTLRDAGLGAADLKRTLNGHTVLWRLQHGEGVTAVLRLFNSTEEEGVAG